MNANTKLTDAKDGLETYFSELSEHGLLTPEEERVLARDVERVEVRTWERVLSKPELVQAVVDIVLARIDRPAKFPKLFAAIDELRRADTPGSQKVCRERYDLAAREAARRLRKLDADLTCISTALRDIPGITGHAERHEAERLRDHFVSSNLRLVVTMARRYDHGIMPLADLIQEGNLGLMHAVSRFNHRRGLRFSTYACWWIRHAIGRALADKARTVRVPVHMLEVQQQIERARQRLTTELGRTPTVQEIARKVRVSVEKIETLQICITGQPVSLDQPLHDQNDCTLIEALTDPNTEEHTAEDEVSERSMLEQMHRLMEQLTQLERAVLAERFGLAGADGRTLRDIGEEHGLSRERIRQIQNGALDKLKAMMEREHGGAS